MSYKDFQLSKHMVIVSIFLSLLAYAFYYTALYPVLDHAYQEGYWKTGKADLKLQNSVTPSLRFDIEYPKYMTSFDYSEIKITARNEDATHTIRGYLLLKGVVFTEGAESEEPSGYILFVRQSDSDQTRYSSPVLNQKINYELTPNQSEVFIIGTRAKKVDLKRREVVSFHFDNIVESVEVGEEVVDIPSDPKDFNVQNACDAFLGDAAFKFKAGYTQFCAEISSMKVFRQSAIEKLLLPPWANGVIPLVIIAITLLVEGYISEYRQMNRVAGDSSHQITRQFTEVLFPSLVLLILIFEAIYLVLLPSLFFVDSWNGYIPRIIFTLLGLATGVYLFLKNKNKWNKSTRIASSIAIFAWVLILLVDQDGASPFARDLWSAFFGNFGRILPRISLAISIILIFGVLLFFYANKKPKLRSDFMRYGLIILVLILSILVRWVLSFTPNESVPFDGITWGIFWVIVLLVPFVLPFIRNLSLMLTLCLDKTKMEFNNKTEKRIFEHSHGEYIHNMEMHLQEGNFDKYCDEYKMIEDPQLIELLKKGEGESRNELSEALITISEIKNFEYDHPGFWNKYLNAYKTASRYEKFLGGGTWGFLQKTVDRNIVIDKITTNLERVLKEELGSLRTEDEKNGFFTKVNEELGKWIPKWDHILHDYAVQRINALKAKYAIRQPAE